MSQVKRLQLAKRTLQNTTVPFPIRVDSYVRLSCCTLDEQGEQYSKLMKALYSYNQEWWRMCQVTSSGKLHSADPIVNQLLRPIEELHRTMIREMIS
ncbi:MAG: hypothetical protein HC881_24510, partial [Leptolyngbyaceae cyanobacterium SL_7_1]|nr:hypothetical protein [Leptolyngbyaceae cyanobacterium SL_7_1]